MLQNVLDIDFHSMRVSLCSPEGAIILFDSEVAFPSIAQDFLMDMLTRLTIPMGSHQCGQSTLPRLQMPHQSRWLDF